MASHCGVVVHRGSLRFHPFPSVCLGSGLEVWTSLFSKNRTCSDFGAYPGSHSPTLLLGERGVDLYKSSSVLRRALRAETLLVAVRLPQSSWRGVRPPFGVRESSRWSF